MRKVNLEVRKMNNVGLESEYREDNVTDLHITDSGFGDVILQIDDMAFEINSNELIDAIAYVATKQPS